MRKYINSPMSYLGEIRYFFGMLLLVSVWIFPFSEGPSRDALSQIYALGILSVSALLFGMSSIPIGVTAICMSALICMLFVQSPYAGGRMAGIAAILLFSIACYVGANLKRQDVALKWILISIVTGALVNAIEGIFQWLGLVGYLSPWVVDTETRGLAFGVFRQRNLFATFIVIGIICTIWLRSINKLTEYFSWFLTFIFSFALAASASRTGMVEVVAIAVFGFINRKNQLKYVTILMVGPSIIYFFATFFLPVIAKIHGFDFSTGVERAASSAQDSRFILWGNVIEMIRERPLSGWGWLDLGYGHYVTIFQERFGEKLHHAHNFPLQIAVEFGIPVLIFFLVVVSIFLINMVKIYKSKNNDEKIGDNFAFLIFFVIFCIHSMLEYPLWYAVFIFLTGLSVGYICGDFDNSQSVSNKFKIRFVKKSLAAFLVLLSIFAYNQYSLVLKIYDVGFGDKVARRSVIMSASDSWLFEEYQKFSALEFIDLDKDNAIELKKSMEKLLHFSAEPRVIRPLLSVLWNLQDVDEFNFHISRFCIVFPIAFLKWKKENDSTPMGLYIDEQINMELVCGK